MTALIDNGLFDDIRDLMQLHFWSHLIGSFSIPPACCGPGSLVSYCSWVLRKDIEV